MFQNAKYVIVTPVRDEEKHIEATIASVSSQTMLPTQWIIVDDGSTDGTGRIIEEYAARLRWITVVHRPNRGFRKSGGGVVDAFNEGRRVLECHDYEFLVKLDGDLSFSSDYFEKCFRRFWENPILGVGGGEIWHDVDGELRVEGNPRFHVRGATKIYRRACWEGIGGLLAAPGWDTLDEVKANMLGWETRSFEDIGLLHHRFTGSADGQLRDRIKHGIACYVCGYHPLFIGAKCIRRLVQTPYVIGSVAILYGFLKGFFTRVPRVNDSQLIQYLRAQQVRRLCGLQTIWK